MAFLELQKHEHINAVLSEALRLYPSAADSLFRVVPAEGGIVAGRFVPPNTSVTVHLLAAFRSPLNLQRPDEFIPGRWIKDCPPEFQSDNKSVFQPFSIGTKNCLGRAVSANSLLLFFVSCKYYLNLMNLYWSPTNLLPSLAWAEMRMILANFLWHH